MKNSIPSLKRASSNTSEAHVKKAIKRIQSWVQKKYPELGEKSRTKMIMECLLELSEERKLLQLQ